jgi:hypothetical protein
MVMSGEATLGRILLEVRVTAELFLVGFQRPTVYV